MKIQNQLDQAVQQVFEGLLFLEANPVSPGELPKSDQLEACLDIQGPVAGQLSLHVSREDSLRLLQCLPNAPKMPDEEAVIDLFAELVNTVGGRFAASFSADSSFDLTIPTVRFASFQPAKQGTLRVYELDAMQLLVEFRPKAA